MAPIGKLYTYPNNPRAFKALLAAKYLGLEIEVPQFQMGVDNKKPEFLKKFPLGKVPAFETSDGGHIFESNAIAHYVAAYKKDSTLLGQTPLEQALVQTFINLTVNEIAPAASTWIYPLLGFVPYNKQNTDKAIEDVKRVLGVLDQVLADKTYLVGESVTMADINVALGLLNLFKLVLDPATRSKYVNVTRWFVTMINQPNFLAVLGEVKLAEKQAEYNGEPYTLAPLGASSASSSGDKKDKKKEEKKEKKEEKKKEEKKKEEKKEEKKKDEQQEESFEDKPKSKNPLDNLPPSTFNLEVWKKFYSNNDEQVAIKYFWENFDPVGFSIWRCDYLDNPLKQRVFMTSNLVGGFLQRAEAVRKYGFGSILVFGDDESNEIHGVWVFRGQDIPQEVLDTPDFESYKFYKVEDINDAKNREIINAFWAWQEIPGVAKFHDACTVPFNSGKNFK